MSIVLRAFISAVVALAALMMTVLGMQSAQNPEGERYIGIIGFAIIGFCAVFAVLGIILGVRQSLGRWIDGHEKSPAKPRRGGRGWRGGVNSAPGSPD